MSRTVSVLDYYKKSTRVNGFSLFTTLWSFQVLVELQGLVSPDFWYDWQYSMRFIAALVLLLFPNSAGIFLLFCLAQLTGIYSKLPQITNHGFLSAIVAAIAIWLSVRRVVRRRSISANQFKASLAPFIVVILSFTYLLSGFHKLNTGFLNVNYSCAAVFLKMLPGGELGPWMRHAAIWGVIIAEFALGVAFLLRPSNGYLLITGCVMHLVFGVAGWYNFSTFFFALYFMLLPTKASKVLCSKFERFFGTLGETNIQLFKLAVVFLFFVRPNLISGTEIGSPLYEVRSEAWFVLFVSALVLISMLLYRTGGLRPASSRRRPTRAHVAPLILAVILCLNGLSPFLGLKSGWSFNMFNNGVTASGHNNYLLKNAALLRIFPYQDDLVQVMGSNQPHLRQMQRSQSLIPFVMLKRHIRKYRDSQPIELKYKRKGMIFETTHAQREPQFLEASPWWLEKLFYFRPVNEKLCQG